MRRVPFLLLGLVLVPSGLALAQRAKAPGSPSWSMKTTIIEACSCPMFCQCYFSTKPAAHHHDGHDQHFCRFNNAYRVDHGRYGKVKLDGAKFWVAGDLGAEFSDGEMDWAVLTFDPAVTKQQREAIQEIVGHVYPVKWKSFTVAQDAPITWTSGTNRAEARLDGGKAGEVVLERPSSAMSAGPMVIKNLKYWGTPRNDGFVLMPNRVEAYRVGDKAFEFKGTNGFMITFDISSKDI